MRVDDSDISYEEKLKYIKETYGYDEQQMVEYEKDIKRRALNGGYVAPEEILSFDYHLACDYVKENERKKIIEQKQKEEKLRAEKKEQIEKAKMMKRYGKVYNSGTSFSEKLDNFMLKMQENKRKLKVWAKMFTRDETVKSAAKTVVNNPSIAVTFAGLMTICVSDSTLTTATGAMMFAAGAGYLYGKFKNFDKEENEANNQNDGKANSNNGIKGIDMDSEAIQNIQNMLSRFREEQKGG